MSKDFICGMLGDLIQDIVYNNHIKDEEMSYNINFICTKALEFLYEDYNLSCNADVCYIGEDRKPRLALEVTFHSEKAVSADLLSKRFGALTGMYPRVEVSHIHSEFIPTPSSS